MQINLNKEKKKGAEKGYDLLKSKADALKVRFRDICKQIYKTKVGMADQSSAAFFSLTQAEYAAGNFRSKLMESNMTASVRLASRTDNVAGVKLPVFTQVETGSDSLENYGLAGGGRKISACREKFGEYLKALIKVASLQTSFIAMDEALKITLRRVNALENVTIPRIVDTMIYIERELDELEREDFTRLKMVKKNKEKALKAKELAEKEAAGLEVAAAAAAAPKAPSTTSKAPTTATKAPSGVSTAPIMSPVNMHNIDITEDGEVPPSAEKPKKKVMHKKSEHANEPPANLLSGFDVTDDSDVVFK
jgi:V-type H+-transporting ATPase subunit D